MNPYLALHNTTSPYHTGRHIEYDSLPYTTKHHITKPHITMNMIPYLASHDNTKHNLTIHNPTVQYNYDLNMNYYLTLQYKTKPHITGEDKTIQNLDYSVNLITLKQPNIPAFCGLKSMMPILCPASSKTVLII